MSDLTQIHKSVPFIAPSIAMSNVAMLEVFARLVQALNAANITYCHWKGNYALPIVLAGQEDFELLVDRKSLDQVLGILHNLGFKRTSSIWEGMSHGIAHYYGFDQQTGRLVHVHLFSWLLTGESFIKSHLLPLEKMLLENGDRIGSVRVPAKPAELVIHLLRVFIKYGSPLDLSYLYKESPEYAAELRWLQDNLEISEALRLLNEYCPRIDESLFIQCLNTLKTPNTWFKRILLARQVRQRLDGYARNSGIEQLGAYGNLFWSLGQRWLGRNKKGKVLDSGGVVIAFVGPDATGKSTLTVECGRWLGTVFPVRIIHAGKPPSSWLTAPVNLAIPLLRKLFPKMRTGRMETHGSHAHPTIVRQQVEGMRGLVYALRAVVLAWDRRELLVQRWRSALRGEIVICDRYPSDNIGAMDSPRLQEQPDLRGLVSRLWNSLARLEHRLYDQIPSPHIVFRLHVSTKTAKIRNRERIKIDKEGDAYVESRHEQYQEWHRRGTRYIYDIDTEQPLAETIHYVKMKIWESL